MLGVRVLYSLTTVLRKKGVNLDLEGAKRRVQ